MAVGDTFRISLGHEVQGVPAWNVLHLVQHTIVDPDASIRDDITVAIGAMINAWTSAVVPELSEDYKLACVEGQRVAPSGSVILTSYPTTSNEGAIVADSVPQQAAMLVRMFADDAPTRSQGRMYIPGIPETMVESGVFLASVFAQYQIAMANFVAVFQPDTGTDPNFHLVIRSKLLGGANYEFSGYQVENALATIRNRRGKHQALK